MQVLPTKRINANGPHLGAVACRVYSPDCDLAMVPLTAMGSLPQTAKSPQSLNPTCAVSATESASVIGRLSHTKAKIPRWGFVSRREAKRKPGGCPSIPLIMGGGGVLPPLSRWSSRKDF